MKTKYELRYQCSKSEDGKMLSMRFAFYPTKKEAIKQARFLSKNENDRFYFVVKTQTENIFKVGTIKT